MRLLAAAVLAASLSGCLYDAPVVRSGSAAPSLVGTTWRGWMLSQNGPWMPFPRTQTYTLTLSRDGQATGNADCNRFFGPYTGGTRGQVRFGGLASTRVGCAEGSMGSAFLRVLDAGTTYVVADDVLTIRTPDGEAVQFRRQR